jgi:hypothetical protein
MPFTPLALPIQQIQLTNFVTDIAPITNANTLLLQANLEDLINNFEIDLLNGSIGTTNPINYLKADSVILQDTGLIFQTGVPTPTIIASLSKNISDESILTVDRIIANISTDLNDLLINNNLTVTNIAQFDGPVEFNSPLEINSSVIESAESIQTSLTWDGVSTRAEAYVTLSNTSRQNIFITLEATNAPLPNPVFDGTSIESSLTGFDIYFDFDATNPPVPNTKFTIYLVGVVENQSSTPIDLAVQTASIEIKLIGGTNLNTTTSIITQDGAASVGIQNTSTYSPFKSNITFNYIIDSSLNDRILATTLVGADLF